MKSGILRRGDLVKLLTKPDGVHSKHLPLTAGNTYTILDFDGGNVVTTTDEDGVTGSYWSGRVKKVPCDAAHQQEKK